MNPGGSNNYDEIRTAFVPDAVCFVENNGRPIKKKCNDPVRRGEKDILCPFSIHYPYYLSIMTLNFNGCFICGSTTHCNKNISPMKEQSGAIEDFYRELNIH